MNNYTHPTTPNPVCVSSWGERGVAKTHSKDRHVHEGDCAGCTIALRRLGISHWGRPTGRCVSRVILVTRSTCWSFNKFSSTTCTRTTKFTKTSDITDVQAVQPDQAHVHVEPFQRGLSVICRAGSITAAFAAKTA